MKRRDFITLLGGAVVWPSAVRAKQPPMALVGLLSSAQLNDRQIGAFRQGLNDAGYVEGRNVAIKYRSADSRFDRLPALAADLVSGPVDAIVALSPPAAVAAHHLESVRHRATEDATTTHHGLTRSRTRAGARSERPYSARAQAIASDDASSPTCA